MARVPASLFPTCQGKPGIHGRLVSCSFTPVFGQGSYAVIHFISLFFLAITMIPFAELGRFCCCGGGLHLGYFIWVQSEKKYLIGIASVQYTGQKCVPFCEPCCKGWLLWGWKKDHFIVLQPALYYCATTSTVARIPAQAYVFTSAGTEDVPHGSCWWIW